ncbi:MAG: ABC transporter ATP-binding protein [Boseongicola sp. SB0676_bin_33]|uniref:ABC transporter ATP-binding protein n=1 Tax=Boseongicola sp. SB0664_bin_43 TaxID=2604844 RepID=A0A6B0Y0E5_9RHOB|nr:ABC transporter ATP-binding protein [Boseongicola sp. SB0664_bin_43]MYF88109.1 ABC transporter ATP-binding protein [Boseongicola sp. SB0676_bin_33]MYK32428.1 ABC transporter ATP-binding protein [Boseongicola sp. SB0670_bin_30]
MALLDIRDLDLSVARGSELLPVVQGVSLAVEENETLGIVGESGCGKSLTALAIMGLLDGSAVRIAGGSIHFQGRDLLALAPEARRRVMGEQMAMIFQEPMTSLNPVYRVGDQIKEAILQHRSMSRRQARERALDLLELVRIPDPMRRIDSFPHQMSGGQRQRVMIAMALACDPKLLIADEPTTALDVTVQKGVLELIHSLQARTGMSVVLISHDLGVISETCDKVAVMYRGRIVEQASASTLFSNMSHPYTLGLLGSIPALDHDVEWLDAIPGRMPTLDDAVPGCAFHPRCFAAQGACRTAEPRVAAVSPAHFVRCHFPQGSSS